MIWMYFFLFIQNLSNNNEVHLCMPFIIFNFQNLNKAKTLFPCVHKQGRVHIHSTTGTMWWSCSHTCVGVFGSHCYVSFMVLFCAPSCVPLLLAFEFRIISKFVSGGFLLPTGKTARNKGHRRVGFQLGPKHHVCQWSTFIFIFGETQAHDVLQCLKIFQDRMTSNRGSSGRHQAVSILLHVAISDLQSDNIQITYFMGFLTKISPRNLLDCLHNSS